MHSASLAASAALLALALHGCGQPNPGPAPTPVGPAVSKPLKSGTFVTYFNYGGSLSVSGVLYFGEVAVGVQVMQAELDGVDPNCTGAQSGAGNRCGIHIHAGESCSEDAMGHHFTQDGRPDPWVPITYTGDGSGSVSVADNNVVDTGFTLAQLSSKVVVVHDAEGTRVACAPLSPVEDGAKRMEVNDIGDYPGSATGFTVAGTVNIVTYGDSGKQALRFDLTGLDSACRIASPVTLPNGCGIHIHSGTTCDWASLVGGHYWDNVLVDEDPWKYITYRGMVATGVTYPVNTGFPDDNLDGKVFVAHSKTGAGIACGKVGVSLSSSVSALNGDEEPGMSPFLWVSMLVVASLFGGAWYYRSQRQGYAAQEDDATEVKTAAAQQDDSTEMNSKA